MGKKEKKARKYLFPPVIPNVNEWPIVQLSRNRHAFLEDVIQQTCLRIEEDARKNGGLSDTIASALYLEKIRMRAKPWSNDPKDEKEYWTKINDKLLAVSNLEDDKKVQRQEEQALLRDIVTRYTYEISGKFDPGAYRFATTVVPHGFARLLNASVRKNPIRILKKRYSLYDKIHFTGPLELIRELSKKGTFVMVPTHFSNLDSLLMGWGINELGLPPFLYGAGFNLFNIRILAYFMNRLGAYKVDRRKKNKIYLETLKMFSRLALHHGAHTLFFPGGTRSRSGSLETSLKLGLLGTAVDAQRINLERNGKDARKVFILPVVINYHFVLESPVLIADYLKRTGKEKYIAETDSMSTSYKLISLLLKFFTISSEIELSFGHPIDLFGNYVSKTGASLDKNKEEIDISKYFISDGQIKEDRQRDAEYTRLLSDRIVEEFRKVAVVFSSHLLAFTAFEMILAANPKSDVYEVLRIPEKEIEIPFSDFKSEVERILKILRVKEKSGELNLAGHLSGSLDEIIAHGLKHVGRYNSKRPLKKNRKGFIITQSLENLYYYHNRLGGYGLESEFEK